MIKKKTREAKIKPEVKVGGRLGAWEGQDFPLKGIIMVTR